MIETFLATSLRPRTLVLCFGGLCVNFLTVLAGDGVLGIHMRGNDVCMLAPTLSHTSPLPHSAGARVGTDHHLGQEGELIA